MLRCYVCGEQVPNHFALMYNGVDDVDRVFVVHEECAESVDASVVYVLKEEGHK